MLFDSLRNSLPKTVIYYQVREAMISLNFFYTHVDRKETNSSWNKEKPNPNGSIFTNELEVTLISPFLTQRTKSKFVVTPPANVTETLLSKNPILCSKKEIPVQYGGNEKDDDTKFSNEADSPTKLFLKLSLTWVICKHRDPSF
ncbi:hypothetical protein YC2023_061896 [Brassica napus]